MTDPRAVTLYGKPDCHLCDEAEAILKRVAADLAVTYRKIDIQSSPELFESFRYRIPVIQVEGGETLDWPTTAERVRRAILNRPSPNGQRSPPGPDTGEGPSPPSRCAARTSAAMSSEGRYLRSRAPTSLSLTRERGSERAGEGV
jgi:hypothetical protein